MGLEGKRVAILVDDDYQMHEFWYPFYRFQEAGAQVRVVGSGQKSSFTSHGYAVTPDLDAKDARVEDFDAVIIPGGQAPDRMRRSAELVAFVRDMDGAGKPVAAICHAGSMLVSAKIARDRSLTSYYSIRDDLEAAGARWSDEPVVVDRNLITSRVPGDLPAFCRAVMQVMSPRAAGVA
jgi:protease I